jgi:hypothetical protein
MSLTKRKKNRETMAPNHVTGVVPLAKAETKNVVVLGLVIGKGTVETGNAKEAEAERNRDGLKAENVENVKEVEAEIGGVIGMDRIDIVVARVKRDEGGRGHAQEIVTLGRGRRLASVEASEVG